MPIIQSVERALRILDLFDEHETELRITEISERMQLHKSTIHSLLKTLQEQKYIDQNPENGKYRLGMKLVERGNFVVSTIDIRQAAKEYLHDLSRKTGQTTHLGILDGQEGVYIDKVVGDKAVIRYSRIGKRIPLHTSAIGKVLLAFQEPKEIQRILQGYVYTVHTERTLRSEAEFLDELEKVNQQGFAVDNLENEQSVRCIAVPIRNYENTILAAISMSTLITEVNDEKLNDFINLLKKAGLELSKKFGYRLYNK